MGGEKLPRHPVLVIHGDGAQRAWLTPGTHFAVQVQSRPGAAWLHPHRTEGGLKSQGPFKGRERKFTLDRPHSEAPRGAVPPYTYYTSTLNTREKDREGQKDRGKTVWVGLRG